MLMLDNCALKMKSGYDARNYFKISWKSTFCYRNHRIGLKLPILSNSNNLQCRFKEDGEIKYLRYIGDLVQPDRSTLEVSFDDVEKYNQNLATSIIEEYYR